MNKPEQDTKQKLDEHKSVIKAILQLRTFSVPELTARTGLSEGRVRAVLAHIEEYQRLQDPAPQKQGGLQIYASKPNEMVVIDTMETPDDLRGTPNLPYYITAIDVHSRVVMLRSCSHKTAANGLALLKEWITRFGYPERVICDEGGEFKKEFLAFCKRKGIEVHAFNASKGRGNALAHVNSFHRYLRRKIRDVMQITGTKAFHEELNTILTEYNTRKKHSTTKQVPLHVMTGQVRSREQQREAPEAYPLGTHVRVRLPSKRNEKKSLRLVWSKDIYRIVAEFSGLMYAKKLDGDEKSKTITGSTRRFMPIPQKTYSVADFRAESIRKPIKHIPEPRRSMRKLRKEIEDTPEFAAAAAAAMATPVAEVQASTVGRRTRSGKRFG